MDELDDIFPSEPDQEETRPKGALSSSTFEEIDRHLTELFEWAMENGEFADINPMELSAHMQDRISDIAHSYKTRKENGS